MSLNKKKIAIIFSLLLLPLAGIMATGTLSFYSSPNYSTLGALTSLCTDGSSLLAKDVSTFPISSDTNYDLQWSSPDGWAVSSVNITLSNITAPTYEKVLEDFADQAIPLLIFNYTNPFQSVALVGAMSFKLSPGQSIYFNKLSVFLVKSPFNESAYVDIHILNATYNGTLDAAAPHEILFSVYNQSIEGGTLEFKDFNLTSPDKYLLLDPLLNQTYENTYFVALAQNISTAPKAIVYWFYAYDYYNGDNGPAYLAAFNIFGQMVGFSDKDFDNKSFDLCLKLYLNATPPSQVYPLPTDIGLKINGISVNNINAGVGWWSTSENLSQNPLIFDVSSTWNNTVSFTATISVTYQNVLVSTFFTMTSLNTYFENQGRLNEYLFLLALGSVAVAAAGGYRANKRRMIPRNALRSLEHIIVDHNHTGVLIWAFDFVSMEQDIALVSGFMAAIKSFLEEMKVGGLKRLSTEFGTFVREESELLTATCITSDIGLDEELWIRGKLHKFLTQIEQEYRKQLEDWKGDVGQFKISFPAFLNSVIDMERVNKLHKQKFSSLGRKKEKLQKEVNKYGAKLEELKSRHDSGEISYDEYTSKRLKIEYKYDKAQKNYIYASLFLSKVPLETAVSPKELEKLEEVQKRFVEIRLEIEELRRKESEGTFTQEDKKQKEKLQKELMKLVEKLDKFKKG
ncbi:MAG: hypothetical protein ACETWM_09025 [Candidatus Lokiarchaeia archaeon]